MPKKRHPNFKGGRIIDPRGYALVYVGKGHHLADVRGYAYEHRIVAEKKLGRRLRRGEEVHHEKSNSDNDPADLTVAKNRAAHNGWRAGVRSALGNRKCAAYRWVCEGRRTCGRRARKHPLKNLGEGHAI